MGGLTLSNSEVEGTGVTSDSVSLDEQSYRTSGPVSSEWVIEKRVVQLGQLVTVQFMCCEPAGGGLKIQDIIITD